MNNRVIYFVIYNYKENLINNFNLFKIVTKKEQKYWLIKSLFYHKTRTR